MRRVNIQGQKFGRLTVIELAPKQEGCRVRSWVCRCDCGNDYFLAVTGALRSGNTKSCGCFMLDSIRERQRKPKGMSGARNAYASCRTGARERGHHFEISFDDFLILSQQPCHYCGVEYSKITKIDTTTQEGIEHSQYKCNGLDRVDNNKGYTLGNLVPCCSHCNYAKRKLSQDEFIRWIGRAYHHIYKGDA